MKTYPHRADVLQGYIAAGLTPVEAIKKFKAENQEYFPKHFSEKGEPLTFEGMTSHLIRVEKMSPDRAVRAATSRSPKLQREFYDRLRVGAAMDSDLERALCGEILSNPPSIGQAPVAIVQPVTTVKPVQPKMAPVPAAPKPVGKPKSAAPAPVTKKKYFNTIPADFQL